MVVKSKRMKPRTDNTIPIVRTTLSDILPVTVGRFCVLSITESISTSYQLFRTRAPAITNVLPIIVSKNTSKCAVNEASVKCNANQNPVKTGSTLEIKTIALNRSFRSDIRARLFDKTTLLSCRRDRASSLLIDIPLHTFGMKHE